MIVCCIDGNIGAGKSSVLYELERRGYDVFREDMSKWGWCLENYYANPERWSFTLQISILNSMVEQRRLMNASKGSLVFIERSPLSGLVFARVAYNRGYMSLDELTLFAEMYEKVGWAPDTVLMLDTPLDACYERMCKRGRDCEKDLDYDYLRDVAVEYGVLKNVRVLDHRGTVSDVADRVVSMLCD